MIEIREQMVRYDTWCKKCKNNETKENDDPCEECLNHPINEHTEKPINFEEK